MIDAVLHHEAAPIPRFNDQAPDALVRVVTTLLEKDRTRRYQSAHQVWTDLRRIKEELASGRVPAAAARPTAVAAGSLWSRWPVRLGLVALILSVITVVVAVRWWPTSPGIPSLGQVRSLVALPARVAGSPEFQYLTDAVPGVISSHLAGVPDLDTKVPASSIEVDKLKDLFEWDASKARGTTTKHAVTFEEALTVFRDPLAPIFADPAHSSHEPRKLIIGHSADRRLVIVSFSERQQRVRIISARRATPREQHDYEQSSK
jgi:hypothetical protein